MADFYLFSLLCSQNLLKRTINSIAVDKIMKIHSKVFVSNSPKYYCFFASNRVNSYEKTLRMEFSPTIALNPIPDTKVKWKRHLYCLHVICHYTTAKVVIVVIFHYFRRGFVIIWKSTVNWNAIVIRITSMKRNHMQRKIEWKRNIEWKTYNVCWI